MSASPEKGRRLKTFRLSDIDPDIRMRAAQQCIDQLARSGVDPIKATFESLKLDAIARDPEAAAATMGADCENEVHVCTLEDWEAAMNPRRRW